MALINCDLDTYQKALGNCRPRLHDASAVRGTPAERGRLQRPEGGLFGADLFPETRHGARVALETWLMVLRADTRGKLALRQLLPRPTFEATGGNWPDGRPMRWRVPASLEEHNKALADQHALITRMVAECPVFFAGMLVDEEAQLRAQIELLETVKQNRYRVGDDAADIDAQLEPRLRRLREIEAEEAKAMLVRHDAEMSAIDDVVAKAAE